MQDAPPYSTTAASSERRLPYDFQPSDRDVDEEDPLASLTRAKTHSSTLSVSSSLRSPHSHLPSSLSLHGHNALTHVLSAPASIPINSPPQSSDPDLHPPPSYAPADDLARSFRLDGPFIYTTRTSNVPRYQLRQEFTRSGKPWKLCIRRLMATETRDACLQTSSAPASPYPRQPSRTTTHMPYDDDATMYAIDQYGMRGQRSSTISGSVKLETGRDFLGVKSTRIFLYTRNARRDSLNPENEARVQKYGYQANEEWDRKLLFRARKGVWEDGKGRRVGRESGGEFEMDPEDRLGAAGRDLLVACWIMRAWRGEGLRWEGDM